MFLLWEKKMIHPGRKIDQNKTTHTYTQQNKTKQNNKFDKMVKFEGTKTVARSEYQCYVLTKVLNVTIFINIYYVRYQSMVITIWKSIGISVLELSFIEIEFFPILNVIC